MRKWTNALERRNWKIWPCCCGPFNNECDMLKRERLEGRGGLARGGGGGGGASVRWIIRRLLVFTDVALSLYQLKMRRGAGAFWRRQLQCKAVAAHWVMNECLVLSPLVRAECVGSDEVGCVCGGGGGWGGGRGAVERDRASMPRDGDK